MLRSLNMNPRNAQFISIFHGWELFQPKLKSKLLQPFKHCYFAVETRVISTTRPLLPTTKKDVLSAQHHNNVIYRFVCLCDSQYIQHTSQRLQEHIKQHVSNHYSSQDHANLYLACKKNSTSQVTTNDSAIGQHLLKKTSLCQPIQQHQILYPCPRTYFFPPLHS